MHVLKKDVLLLGTKGLFIGYVAMATIAFQNGGLIIKLRGCLHESGLSFNPDRTHSVSVEIIGDWIIFVYMNPDWVATHSGSSTFHFSFQIEHSIRNEMSIRNHVNLDRYIYIYYISIQVYMIIYRSKFTWYLYNRYLLYNIYINNRYLLFISKC